MLELADVIAHRALAYVTATERQGYSMTVDELAAYMARPTRRPGKPGTSGKPARTLTTTKVDRAIAEIVANSLQPTMRALGASLAAALDVREQTFDAIPGSPGEQPEPIAEWLSRLGWLKVTQERIGITKLGRAVLAHLEQESLEDEIPIGIVLNQGDDLAEARVIAHIAGLGSCAVIDRYFSMESLLHVAYSTEVEMVLVGTDDKSKLAGLEASLPRLKFERSFEIRKSDVFHDRFVIPTNGPVWLLGTSLSGLGRRLSVMVELTDEAMSDAIRHEFTHAWEAAEPVVPAALELLPSGDS